MNDPLPLLCLRFRDISGGSDKQEIYFFVVCIHASVITRELTEVDYLVC